MNNRTKNTLSLQVEALEERAVPASLSINGGFLDINGTNYPDTVRIIETPNNVRVDMNGTVDFIPKSKIPYGIFFHGKYGDDLFENRTSFKSWAWGDQGDDILIGGSNFDYLAGGADVDYIEGKGGGDVLVGGDHTDLLIGGPGNDFVFGGDGNDHLYGSGGSDHLDGGDDNDELYGDYHTSAYLSSSNGTSGVANNQQFADAGVDALYGRGGDDVLDGGLDFKHDVIRPGVGEDKVVIYWHNSGSGWWEDWSQNKKQFDDEDGRWTYFRVYVDR